MYGRNKHNVVNQLFFNEKKKNFLKTEKKTQVFIKAYFEFSLKKHTDKQCTGICYSKND